VDFRLGINGSVEESMQLDLFARVGYAVHNRWRNASSFETDCEGPEVNGALLVHL